MGAPWLLLVLVAGVGAVSIPPQLNASAFSGCMHLEAGDMPFNSSLEDKRYHLSELDGLLLYLALYAGQRYPIINATQQDAFERWGMAFWREGAYVANGFRDRKVTPGDITRLASHRCRGSWLCVRWHENIDRHTGADYNAAWFKDNKTQWLKDIPLIEKNMVPLQKPNYILPEQFGSWYHSFGLFTFGVHEMSLAGDFTGMTFDELVALLDSLLNSWITGNKENPVKAQIDRDSVKTIYQLAKGYYPKGISNDTCETQSGYVNRDDAKV